jgi:predicted DsbA family dithiol-disulfide isomerase
VVNKKFLEDLVNSTYGWQVRSDLLEGLDKGVRDVPAFFINDELFTGKPTFENLRKGIEAALRQQKEEEAGDEGEGLEARGPACGRGIVDDPVYH